MKFAHFRPHLVSPKILSNTFGLVLVAVICTLMVAKSWAVTKKTENVGVASQESTGFCFDIYAGAENLGSVLEIKKFVNNIHSNILLTQLQSKPLVTKASSKAAPKSFFQVTKSESDEHFTPLNATFEVYEGAKKVQSKISSFESQKDGIKITTKDSSSKTPTISQHPKGLVLSQQMSDLLFARRKITEISPKEKLIFQTFSESEARNVQVTTALEGETDHLVLLHQIEGQNFKTTHTADGTLISSHDLTKNIKLKPCTSSSVLSHMNSALSHKPFQSLFSLEDREKIKSCCQHF